MALKQTVISLYTYTYSEWLRKHCS